MRTVRVASFGPWQSCRRGKPDDEQSSVEVVRSVSVGKARSLTPWNVALAYVLRGVSSWILRLTA